MSSEVKWSGGLFNGENNSHNDDEVSHNVESTLARTASEVCGDERSKPDSETEVAFPNIRINCNIFDRPNSPFEVTESDQSLLPEEYAQREVFDGPYREELVSVLQARTGTFDVRAPACPDVKIPEVATVSSVVVNTHTRASSTSPCQKGSEGRKRCGTGSATPSESSWNSAPDIGISPSIFESDKPVIERSSGGSLETSQSYVQSCEGPRRSLTNFFEFGNKPLPEIDTSRKTVDNSEPVRKLPRLAHYKLHDPQDEVKYVDENRILHNEAIPIAVSKNKEQYVDSEDEDGIIEQTFLPRVFRQKEGVFDKYNFEHRKFSTGHLAAHQQKQKIIAAIEKNRVVIVDGFTGCGKTTQVPQFIIDHSYERKRPCNVIVAQPRRIAAISVARRVCDERGWGVGTVVGYQVGMEKVAGDDTLVTFMTTGVLLQKLIRSRSLRQWSHIIIDEVHERDLLTDLLLLFIKKILLDDMDGHQKNVKLILMSATLNTKQFSEYFKTKRNDEGVGETPVVKIPSFQRKFQIEVKFLDQLVSSKEELEEYMANFDLEKPTILPEMYQCAVRTITQLDELERKSAGHDMKIRERGSVLVFLPGLLEIKTMKQFLNDEDVRRLTMHKLPSHDWDIVPLHSSITSEEQSLVFKPPVDYRRKIILSTNIAESSITVADIVYILDFCLTKSNCVDSNTNFSSLRPCWTSVNQSTQRTGRAGRVRDGKVYRMVPKEFFGSFSQEAVPDMQKSALEDVVLQVKTLDMGSPQEMLCLALNPPEMSGIERAVATLKEVGAMTLNTTVKKFVDGKVVYSMKFDTCDGDLTYLGKIMATVPVSPQCARLIMLGHCFGVLKESLIIAAGLSCRSLFAVPFEKQLESYLRKLGWSRNAYSDCFAVLYAYLAWKSQFDSGSDVVDRSRKEKYWCNAHYIQVSQMREIRNLVDDLEERLKRFGIFGNAGGCTNDSALDSAEISKEAALMLKIAVAGAFYPNYFQPHSSSSNDYARERTKEVGGNDVFSTVYYKNFPTGNNRQHEGKLYAKRISDELSHGLSVPFVKFEGQKVLATFEGPGKKIGPIYESVYRAVKKRQARHNLELNLLGIQEEKAELEKFEDELSNRHYLQSPRQVALPSVAVSHISVCVTHVETPSQFWVINYLHRVKQEEMAATINALQMIPFPRHDSIYVNALVLAPFTDECGNVLYFRAQIQALNNIRQCLAYFIDYGNSSWIDIRCLRQVTSELLKKGYHNLPGLAVECRMSETKPAVVHGSVWTGSAVKKFKEFVANMQVLSMKIFAVDRSIIIGELLNSDKQNINFLLKKENFADYGPEPDTATWNHEARFRLHLMSRSQIEAYNAKQVAKMCHRDFIYTPRYGRIACKLKGPFSPMELDFQSLCQSSNSKQVTVDNHSVNSVVLDHELNGPNSRLLVAANINIHEKSGKVVARDTTLMPSIPGMLAMMALVFAPRAELRCDPQLRQYTGVLCGLGVDPENKEPVYMDHDLEVLFDTEIDGEDIELVNYIRNDLNILLRENTGCNPTSLHGNLSKNMMRLLKRNRKKVKEQIYPQESYVWGRIPPRSIILAPRNLFPAQPLDIFLPHNTVQLRPEDPSLMSWDFAI
ncbi:unnamed protein product [Allacma fusca]|uniref:Probable ATP-dependent RNA helicase spindle-E n=1 Tax=Allacma fusca TaxID=39272 RepID=A0A8J2JU85_9HEXA|nr:unnamed protein product [Allacma fusca]